MNNNDNVMNCQFEHRTRPLSIECTRLWITITCPRP